MYSGQRPYFCIAIGKQPVRSEERKCVLNNKTIFKMSEIINWTLAATLLVCFICIL